MKYKHKNLKKPAALANATAIGADLIRNERFAEIVQIFNQTTPSRISERYLYAYALWSTGEPVLALINLWPLANKGQLDLMGECKEIAQQIFRTENWPKLASELPGTLSGEEFQTLYMALKGLMPHSQVFLMFQQHFLTCLWQRGEYERLEQILKAQKAQHVDQQLALCVENLSKLTLLRADKKLISANVPAFVGQILTGGASLIMRTTTYQQEVAAAMQALGAEIKYQYAKLTSQYQHKLAWGKEAFTNLVNCEASIVIQVLKYALIQNSAAQQSAQSIALFPTPSYIFNNDTTPGSAAHAFLAWLSNVDHELWQLYQPETYRALLWALGGDKASLDNKLVKKLINQFQQWNPYLRLAFVLRGSLQQKPTFSGLVQLSDFKHLNTPELEFTPAANLFENLVLQSIQSGLNAENSLELAPKFWQLLLEFYPVWQAKQPGIKNNLIIHELTLLHKAYTQRHSLKFNNLISMAQQLSEFKLEQQVLALNQRQQDCRQFLAQIKTGSTKLIKELKDKAALQHHLTLIADSCCLLYADLPFELFTHLEALVTNKKINKLIKLRELLECEFDCACASCKQDLYRRELPALGTELGLTLAVLPELAAYTQAAATTITQPIKTSVLAQADPFKVLAVKCDASKLIIMQQLMYLMQKNPDQMPLLRQAQSELFNPAQRFVHHYLRYLAQEEPIPTADECDYIAAVDPAPALKISLRHELLNVN